MRLPSLATPARTRTHRLLPRRVGVRLTLLYGVLFVVSGAVLLGITYLLVAGASGSRVLVEDPGGRGVPRADGGLLPDAGAPGPGPRPGDVTRQLTEQAARQHAANLRELLVQSGIALAVMVVVSVVLGWLIAHRVLRPLRTMTGTIRRISADNIHERLAVTGPADELKDLADTVDGLLGRLETALDAHRRFVANAAHELRTPLTLEHALLEESLIDRDATTESFRANFERLLEISEQQARLLESLLALAGSQRGLDRREVLDLALVAEQVVGSAGPEIARRGLRADTAMGPAALLGDPGLVQRLVSDLVDNAVRHNLPGGRLELATGSRGGRAVLAVSNTGPPVPPDHVERLFEPFQRLGRTAAEGHHGLGLSIVHAVAAAHDAVISAASRPGGGLAVEVVFPPCAPYSGEHGTDIAQLDNVAGLR
ncbi:sensor histidine kinase [Streptomyces silaceus]|uniref:sensor histidine kinase n=1 Tax=Streptomyces silaceus TaxID=545123 RepID=UPI0007C8469E|nr:ATP-binding protein [Streptomyces silaceus]